MKDSSFCSITDISEKEEKVNKSIINTKHLVLNDDINLKSRFARPNSILNYIIKYNKDQKYNEENIRFNFKKIFKKMKQKKTKNF